MEVAIFKTRNPQDAKSSPGMTSMNHFYPNSQGNLDQPNSPGDQACCFCISGKVPLAQAEDKKHGLYVSKAGCSLSVKCKPLCKMANTCSLILSCLSLHIYICMCVLLLFACLSEKALRNTAMDELIWIYLWWIFFRWRKKSCHCASTRIKWDLSAAGKPISKPSASISTGKPGICHQISMLPHLQVQDPNQVFFQRWTAQYHMSSKIRLSVAVIQITRGITYVQQLIIPQAQFSSLVLVWRALFKHVSMPVWQCWLHWTQGFSMKDCRWAWLRSLQFGSEINLENSTSQQIDNPGSP